MAKDNFWKSAVARRALLGLANRWEDDDDAKADFIAGELFDSDNAKRMLKAAGVKYPSQLDRDMLERGSKGFWDKLSEYIPYGPLSPNARNAYREFANIYGTDDSFRYRLIGMTRNDPELNEIIFNEDGTINEANLNRITRVAKAKLGAGTILDPFWDNPNHYYINPEMSEDEAGFRAEKVEDYLGDALNGNINGSGELLALNDRVNREYNNRAKQQAILEAARAGSLANNDVEATIGGDPVSVLPSYVQASYKKTPEEEKEEQLLKIKQDNQADIDRLVKYAIDDFNANKKDLAWWL